MRLDGEYVPERVKVFAMPPNAIERVSDATLPSASYLIVVVRTVFGVEVVE
jgi:hypothetical protein